MLACADMILVMRSTTIRVCEVLPLSATHIHILALLFITAIYFETLSCNDCYGHEIDSVLHGRTDRQIDI